jgi:hypothetical protein
MRNASTYLAAAASAALILTSLTPSGLALAEQQSDDQSTVYVSGASPDQNEQFLCGKTVVVVYNALRYSNAQLAVSHTYTLPTTISLFGNLNQSSNITQTATKAAAGASGGANPGSTPAPPDEQAAAKAVQKAISSVTTAQKSVAKFQQSVATQATEVESLVIYGDQDDVVRAAAASTSAAPAPLLTQAAKVATDIATPLSWPTTDIINAAADVQTAQAMTLTTNQSTVINTLSTTVASMQKSMADPNDPATLTAQSLVAWERVLANVQPKDFILSQRVKCPSGVYADNAVVSFVAVDRTLVSSVTVAQNGNTAGNNPGGGNTNPANPAAPPANPANNPTPGGTKPPAGASGGAHSPGGNPAQPQAPGTANNGGNLGQLSPGQGNTGNTTTNTGGTQTTTQKQTQSVSKAVAVINAPSRLTATQGVGYSAIPNASYQTGTTLQNGANVTQVQSNQADSGQVFLMTTLVHYRFNNPGPIGIHATIGITTSKNQLVNGVIGASVSLNQAIYFTVGLFRANVTTLNGYSIGEIVPSGTALTTTTQAVNRIGFAVSIPIFPAESGKGSPPATPTPTPPKP